MFYKIDSETAINIDNVTQLIQVDSERILICVRNGASHQIQGQLDEVLADINKKSITSETKNYN